MRILQIVHGFPPNEWAGTELVTLHLSQALRDRGHDVTVLTRIYDPQSPEGTVRETSYESLPVFQLVNNYTASSTFRLSYDNPLFNRPFLQVLERVRPEVVHFQHTQHLSVSLLRLAAALGYPTVLSLHDFFFACHRIQLINAQQQLCPGPDQGERCVSCLQALTSADEARRRFLDMQRVLRAPDTILAPSVFLAQKIQTYFPFLESKLRAVSLGVKGVVGVNRERQRRAPNTPLRILYVGVLAPHKGAHVLIDALKGLSHDNITVSLYGMEWSQWQTYIDQLRAAAHDLPVKFCGTYTHDELGVILQQHDVLVMPMIWEETFSLLVREAFLAGLPVVAARRGALVEAVQDGVNGLLFEPENAEDLRRCLQRMLTEPDLLDQLRCTLPQVKTMELYAQEIENVYTEVITKRRVGQTKIEHPEGASEEISKGGDDAGKIRAQGIAEALPTTASFTSCDVHESYMELRDREAVTGQPVPLSICIPTYNGAAFLAEAIRSVLNQSYRDFELLIVDDRSSDSTVEIARSFADSRLRVIQNERQLGIPRNWNRCVSLARGEYICIFHQDDVMLPKNLERKLSLLEAHADVSFVHSAVELLVESTNIQPPANWIESAADDFTVDGRRYFRKLLLQGNLICAPAVIARRQQLLNVGGFDEELGYTPDYEMWLKLCVSGRVAFLCQSLLQYRWHQKNASHQYRFARGVEELQLAGRRALQYDKETTGASEEREILEETLVALGRARHWAATLEQGNEWLERQTQDWQQTAKERDQMIQKQQAWIAELEKGKAWLDEQRVNWQRMVEVGEKTIQDQQAWIAELEKGKAWLDEQQQSWRTEASRCQAEAERCQAEASHWQAEAERWQIEARDWQMQLWTRVGVRLGVVKPTARTAPKSDQETPG